MACDVSPVAIFVAYLNDHLRRSESWSHWHPNILYEFKSSSNVRKCKRHLTWLVVNTSYFSSPVWLTSDEGERHQLTWPHFAYLLVIPCQKYPLDQSQKITLTTIFFSTYILDCTFIIRRCNFEGKLSVWNSHKAMDIFHLWGGGVTRPHSIAFGGVLSCEVVTETVQFIASNYSVHMASQSLRFGPIFHTSI